MFDDILEKCNNVLNDKPEEANYVEEGECASRSKYKIKINEDSNFIKHARREFKAIGWTDRDGYFKDGMQRFICEKVLELLSVFDSQGHSGFSALYALGMFKKLSVFEPLEPITGED